MAKYELTKKATKDLGEIWNYTVDTWSENQADQYYFMLLDSCQDIADVRATGKQYEGIYSGLLGIKAGKHMRNPQVAARHIMQRHPRVRMFRTSIRTHYRTILVRCLPGHILHVTILAPRCPRYVRRALRLELRVRCRAALLRIL